MELEFTKMEGLGNDFVIIDDRETAIEAIVSYPDLAVKLCDRHFGVGADGIILILPSQDHDFTFRIFNSDGSSAQMCGNGMRCVARYVYEKQIVSQKTMQVDTLAGTVVPEVLVDENGAVISVRVDMGEPVLACEKIPFQSETETAVDLPLTVGDAIFQITAVSMGNPHAVTFVDDVDAMDIKTIGPIIETHDRFLEKTNVEFIEVVSPAELKMKVWERGAGITLACGTGACASLVAAHLTGRADTRAVIHLDGGDLQIFWDKETNHLFKEGPANYAFEGTVTLP